MKKITFLMVAILMMGLTLLTATADVADDLQHYYSFDVDTSDDVGVLDATIQGDAVIHQNVGCALGSSGCYDLDGYPNGDDFIRVGDTGISGTEDWTFSGWFYPENLNIGGGNPVVLYQWNGVGNGYMSTSQTGSGAMTTYFQVTPTLYNIVNNAQLFSDFTWTMVTMTKNGTEFVIYINGTEVNRTLDGNSALDNVVIGGLSNGALGDWWGDVDEVGIWNRTLESFEVQALYENQCNPATTPNCNIVNPPVVRFAGNNTPDLSYQGENFNLTYELSAGVLNATCDLYVDSTPQSTPKVHSALGYYDFFVNVSDYLEGWHTFQVFCSNADGNATSSTKNLFVDSDLPSLTILSPTENQTQPITEDMDVDVKVSGVNLGEVSVLLVDDTQVLFNDTIANETGTSTTRKYKINKSNLKLGKLKFKVSGKNEVGNESNDANVSVRVYAPSNANNYTDGLVHYYSFDSGVNDEVGNVDGVIIGDAVVSQSINCVSGNCYDLDGYPNGDDFIKIGDLTGDTDDWTQNLWVYPENMAIGGGNPVILFSWYNAGYGYLRTDQFGGGKLYSSLTFSPVSYQVANDGQFLVDYYWSMVTITKNGTEYVFYHNGTEINRTVDGLSPLNDVVIGGLSNGALGDWWGDVDEYGVWDRPLRPEEVQVLFEERCNPVVEDDCGVGFPVSVDWDGLETQDLVYRAQDFVMQYNLTDGLYELLSVTCDLKIDGVVNQSAEHFDYGVYEFTVDADTLSEGWHNFQVDCTNGAQSDTTSVKNINLDFTIPNINLFQPSLNSSHYQGDGIPVEVNFINTALKQISVVLYDENGTPTFNHTVADEAGNFTTRNYTINASDVAVGLNTLQLYASDEANLTNEVNISLYVYGCVEKMEDWQPQYSSCTVGDNQTLTYTDANSCGTYFNVPVDNNSVVSCNYCTADYTQVPTECGYDYTWNNYDTCCAVTGIESDCTKPIDDVCDPCGTPTITSVGSGESAEWVYGNACIELHMRKKYDPVVTINSSQLDTHKKTGSKFKLIIHGLEERDNNSESVSKTHFSQKDFTSDISQGYVRYVSDDIAMGYIITGDSFKTVLNITNFSYAYNESVLWQKVFYVKNVGDQIIYTEPIVDNVTGEVVVEYKQELNPKGDGFNDFAYQRLGRGYHIEVDPIFLSSTYTPTNDVNDISGLVIDFGVEFGASMIDYAGLIALVGVVVFVFGAFGIKKWWK